MMQKCIGNMKYEIHHLIEITFHISSDHSQSLTNITRTRYIILFSILVYTVTQYHSKLTSVVIEVISNH